MKTLTNEEKEKVKDIIADEFYISVEQIQDNAHLENDFGVDSLDKVHLIIQLEKAFNVSINDDDIGLDNVVKVSDLFKLLELSIPKINPTT